MAKKRAEHIVGKKYYYDEVIPERAKTRTRSKAKQTKYKKHFGSQETIFLNSTEILKSQKLGYLSLMVKLRKDKSAIVYLYDYSNKKTTYLSIISYLSLKIFEADLTSSQILPNSY